MRRGWLPVIVAWLFAVPTAAQATPLEDPATAFAMDIPDAPGGRVCRVLPLETADTSPECASARPLLSGDQSERVIGVFMLRYPSHDASMGVSVSDREGIGEISEESVALLREKYAKSMNARGLQLVARGGGDPVRSELVEVNGARGVHITVVVAAEDGLYRFSAYTFYQQDRTHNLVFTDRLDHDAEALAYEQRALASLRAPRGELRLFGKPRWMRNAHWHAMRMLPLFIVALIVIPALWLWDRRRRARPTASSRTS
jgi:hypothetical protein